MTCPDEIFDRVVSWTQNAQRVLFVTGAGMSADSGLPTYRGIGGLYHDENTPEGVSIEEALSGGMLRRNPALCWKYIGQIEAACRGAKPNPGHCAITALESPQREVWVLTQNVDGLHQEARNPRVIPIHGDVHDLLCTQCTWTTRVPDYSGLTLPPACPECEGLVRPRVVLFGEMLPDREITTLQTQLSLGFDLVFSVGTTSVFPYIAQPIALARHWGIPSVEINPGPTQVSRHVTEKIEEKAASFLERLTGVL